LGADSQSAEREGGMMHLKHCCEPNLGLQGQIVFVAMRDIAGCRRYLCWNSFSAVSGRTRILDQAARSIGSLTSLCANVCHPSTLRMVISPAARSAQNNMAAVSAEGSTVWVLMRRLNSSWSRSIALVVRALFHWLTGNRVKVNSRSPASSRLSATALHLNRHLRMKARRRTSISAAEVA